MGGLRISLRAIAAVLVLCLAAGCASTGEQDLAGEPPLHQLGDFPEAQQSFPIEVYDPWERFNRGMYEFNAAFDDLLRLEKRMMARFRRQDRYEDVAEAKRAMPSPLPAEEVEAE